MFYFFFLKILIFLVLLDMCNVTPKDILISVSLTVSLLKNWFFEISVLFPSKRITAGTVWQQRATCLKKVMHGPYLKTREHSQSSPNQIWWEIP
jgi:hypothetical protein